VYPPSRGGRRVCGDSEFGNIHKMGLQVKNHRGGGIPGGGREVTNSEKNEKMGKRKKRKDQRSKTECVGGEGATITTKRSWGDNWRARGDEANRGREVKNGKQTGIKEVGKTSAEEKSNIEEERKLVKRKTIGRHGRQLRSVGERNHGGGASEPQA